MLQISNQAVKETSSTKKMALGTVGETPDGSVFRYSRAGAAALVAANLMVAADPLSNHQNRLIDDVVTAPAVGDKKVTILSIGATAMTADQYTDGYLVTRDNAGEGYRYQVEGHKAYDSSGTDILISLRDPIEVALTSASEVVLEYNPWDLVVLSATDQADLCVGVAHTAVAINYYAWLQVGGIAPVWGDEAFASGSALTIGTGVAGQAEALDAAGEQQIGIALRAGVDAEHTLAMLQLN